MAEPRRKRRVTVSLKRDFIASVVVASLAAAIGGPLYAATAGSLWRVIVGLLSTVVGIAVLLNELIDVRWRRRS
jgi:hypothetical protein